MSSSQAAGMTELLGLTSGSAEWLDDKALLLTIQIALRSDSVQHAEVASRLYKTLEARRQVAVSAKPAHEELLTEALELVRAMALAKHDQDAMMLCMDYARGHRQPLRLWRALLTTYRDVGDLVGFLKVRDFMSIHQFVPDVHILNLQLELLNSSGLYEDAKTLYSDMPSAYQVTPTWQTRLIMLDICMNMRGTMTSTGEHKNFELGQEIYGKINRIDIGDHHAEVFPKLLSWLVYNGGSIDTLRDKVREMEDRHDLKLDVHHVNAMLYAANASENWLMVERIWKTFESADIYPTSNTFSLRMAASVMGRDTTAAKQIYQASKVAGYADMLDPLALQTLLAAEMMHGQSEDTLCVEILQTLEKMSPFPITPTSLMFLIPKMMEKKQFAELEGILEKSRERADWDTTRTVETILDQLASAKDGKAVWNNFVLLKNLFWDDPLYTLEARTRVLQRMIELDEPKMAGQMFAQFLRCTVKPDNAMYIFVLQGAREMRDYDLIRRVHQFIKMDMNISEHSAVLNTLMNAYAYVHSSLTFDIWEQIFRSGRGPSQASVSIVLDGCTYSRVPNKGRHIWRTLELRKFEFNDNNYASYVEMLNKHGETAEAIAFLEREMGMGRKIGGRAIGTLYNTSSTKSEVAKWAAEACPLVWASLQK